MSLRHALLGLLADQPSSGYDLTKRFERALQKYAWYAKHSQIYPELSRLAGDGLIEMIDEGSRGRKTYAITASGREELRRWLMTPPQARGVRNEFVLRLFLLSTLEAPEARRLLSEYADEARRELTHLHELIQHVESRWKDDPLDFGRLAAEYGLRSLQCTQEWARWAVEQLDRADARTLRATPECDQQPEIAST
jgi:PadR family transcriptional regulator, regulatory protein AphA